MIQEIIVAIIGLAVVGIVARRIYLFFFGKAKNDSVCGCSSCHCNTVKK